MKRVSALMLVLLLLSLPGWGATYYVSSSTGADDTADHTAAEKAQVLAGDVIELTGDVPRATVVDGVDAVSAFVDNLMATRLNSLAKEYNYYGYTQD